MPRRSVVKEYVEGGYYHIYNRGVEKRTIFKDAQDYSVFLGYLKLYLEPPDTGSDPSLNFSKEVKLISYCLMPNHFHFFVQQKTKDGITKFMKSLGTKYSMYFNFKYERTGSLFEGAYKAGLIQTDQQLMHLSRYIHLNPLTLRRSYKLYPFSSLKHYISGNPPKWLKTDPALSLFKDLDEYLQFHSGGITISKEELGKLVIE